LYFVTERRHKAQSLPVHHAACSAAASPLALDATAFKDSPGVSPVLSKYGLPEYFYSCTSVIALLMSFSCAVVVSYINCTWRYLLN